MGATSIEWATDVWNPVAGCTWKSPGCDNCYAVRMTRRLSAMGQADYDGLTTRKHFNGTIKLRPDMLPLPLRWRKPRRIFVNSMSDLFHPDVPDWYIDRVFGIMAAAPRHTFLVLTKRAERLPIYFGSKRTYLGKEVSLQFAISVEAGDQCEDGDIVGDAVQTGPWPLHNVWLGVSVEDQKRADERIPLLLKTPAAVRFISAEPLLGHINLHLHNSYERWASGGGPNECKHGIAAGIPCNECSRPDWVIVGCESKGNRVGRLNGALSPAEPHSEEVWRNWAGQIVAQCRGASIAAFVKQVPINGRVSHDLSEFPPDLRVREMPEGCAHA